MRPQRFLALSHTQRNNPLAQHGMDLRFYNNFFSRDSSTRHMPAWGSFSVAFQAAWYGAAVVFVSFPLSKYWDLSCHCSWLSDYIFTKWACALWSFRTLGNSRFILTLCSFSLRYYHQDPVCQEGLFKVKLVIAVRLEEVLSHQVAITIRHLWRENIT